jgi:aryl-alcohol dehydrogenase-like predicted oxidoreductase
MSDETRGRHSRPDDETRPIDLGRTPLRGKPLATDPEPAVAAALAVVERSLEQMANRATRPLLDPPTQPFRLRPLGRTGLGVFPVALDVSRLGRTADRTSAHRALDAYAASGGNTLVIDDAADGAVAQLVGTWLASRKRLGRTVLAARVGTAGDLTASGLPSAVERLLHRLGAERLDLLVLAGHDRGTSMEETLTAVAGLLDEDRIAHLAAGDHEPERLIQARVLAGQRGLPRFEAVLPVHSLLKRTVYETGVAPVAHAQELAVLPRSPLAGGFLAAPVPTRGALRRLRELDPARAERLQPSLTRRGMRVVDTVVRFAEEREVPPAAIALSWLLTRPHITAPVVSATSVEQVWAATAAAGVHLSRAEVTALERASAD